MSEGVVDSGVSESRPAKFRVVMPSVPSGLGFLEVEPAAALAAASAVARLPVSLISTWASPATPLYLYGENLGSPSRL